MTPIKKSIKDYSWIFSIVSYIAHLICLYYINISKSYLGEFTYALCISIIITSFQYISYLIDTLGIYDITFYRYLLAISKFQIFVSFTIAFLLSIYVNKLCCSEHLEPELKVGDSYLWTPWAYKINSPKRGDIVVYSTNKVNRIFGLPNEKFKIVKGDFYINNIEIVPSIRPPFIFPETNINEIKVPNTSYLCLSTNTEKRSPQIELINKKDIKGKAFFLTTSLFRLGILDEMYFLVNPTSDEMKNKFIMYGRINNSNTYEFLISIGKLLFLILLIPLFLNPKHYLLLLDKYKLSLSTLFSIIVLYRLFNDYLLFNSFQSKIFIGISIWLVLLGIYCLTRKYLINAIFLLLHQLSFNLILFPISLLILPLASLLGNWREKITKKFYQDKKTKENINSYELQKKRYDQYFSYLNLIFIHPKIVAERFYLNDGIFNGIFMSVKYMEVIVSGFPNINKIWILGNFIENNSDKEIQKKYSKKMIEITEKWLNYSNLENNEFLYAQFIIAYSYYKLNDYENFLIYNDKYDKTYSINLYNEETDYYVSNQKYEDAIKSLEKKKNIEHLYYKEYIKLVDCYEKIENLVQVIENLEGAYHLSNEDFTIIEKIIDNSRKLAEQCVLNKNYSTAIDYYKKIEKRTELTLADISNLGISYKGTGNYDTAISYFEKFLKKQASAEVYIYLADCYQKKKDMTKYYKFTGHSIIFSEGSNHEDAIQSYFNGFENSLKKEVYINELIKEINIFEINNKEIIIDEINKFHERINEENRID